MRRNLLNLGGLGLVAGLFLWSFSTSRGAVDAITGKPAPAFVAKTLDGKTVSLDQLKGKVVLLDFWAVWCPPCVAGLPHLADLAADEKKADQGLVIIAVNAGDSVGAVKKFIKPEYKFSTVIDTDESIFNAYKAVGLPSRVVVGRDGMVKFAVEGFGLGEDTDQKVLDAVDKELATK